MADQEELVVRVDGDLDVLRESLARTRQELELASRLGRGFGNSLSFPNTTIGGGGGSGAAGLGVALFWAAN